MLEGASLLSFYLAFALVHGGDARRFPARSCKPTRALLHAMRFASIVTTALAVALWTHLEGLTAALLVGLGALSTAATAFVLLAPIAGRVLWALALASPLLIAALAFAGGGHD